MTGKQEGTKYYFLLADNPLTGLLCESQARLAVSISERAHFATGSDNRVCLSYLKGERSRPHQRVENRHENPLAIGAVGHDENSVAIFVGAEGEMSRVFVMHLFQEASRLLRPGLPSAYKVLSSAFWNISSTALVVESANRACTDSLRFVRLPT